MCICLHNSKFQLALTLVPHLGGGRGVIEGFGLYSHGNIKSTPGFLDSILATLST